MANEDKRRLAGARGAGDEQSAETSVTAPGKKDRPRSAEDVKKTLHPDFIKFPLTRKVTDPETKELVDKTFTLVIPTVFTVGDVIKDEVIQDFDAYVRLVMVELAKVSSINLTANPTLMFSTENAAYLDVVICASNVRLFMYRVLSKSAYLVDPDDAGDGKKKYVVREMDLKTLSPEQCLVIGAHYVGRWLDRWVAARKAAADAEKDQALSKNADGATQAT